MTKKQKESTHKKLKKKAWKYFSLYIRLKGADKDGNCQCVTCGVTKHFKELHAGHFIDGRGNAVLFDERLVQVQCFRCNSKLPGCLAGNKVKYTLFMINDRGWSLDAIEHFEKLKHKVVKISDSELQEIIDYYKYQIGNLEYSNIYDQIAEKNERKRLRR